MTDLTHVYTTDIQYQETQVDAADTQFDIQRMGHNCNYEYDTLGPLASALSTLAGTICRFTAFTHDMTVPGPGNYPVFNSGGPGVYMALIWIVPSTTNQQNSHTGSGIGSTITIGAPIPFACTRDFGGGLTPNWQYVNPLGGSFRFDVTQASGYTEVVMAANTSGNFTIRGVAFHA